MAFELSVAHCAYHDVLLAFDETSEALKARPLLVELTFVQVAILQLYFKIVLHFNNNGICTSV